MLRRALSDSDSKSRQKAPFSWPILCAKVVLPTWRGPKRTTAGTSLRRCINRGVKRLSIILAFMEDTSMICKDIRIESFRTVKNNKNPQISKKKAEPRKMVSFYQKVRLCYLQVLLILSKKSVCEARVNPCQIL